MATFQQNRRTVLKTIGSCIVGSAAISGTATSHDTGGPSARTFAWSDHGLWELLDVDQEVDEDGDHPTLYLIQSMENEQVNGAEHSPHDKVPWGRPPDVPVDYVIDASNPSVRSINQWNVKIVVGSAGILPGPKNFVEGIGYLTSVEAILNAARGPDPSVDIVDADISSRLDDFITARPIREHQ